MFSGIADELVRIAHNLQHVGRDTGARSTEPHKPQSEQSLIEAAERLLKFRRDRAKYLPQDFFGDAAWGMLLDLFVSESRDRKLSTTSLCHGSLTPQTTALRWLEVLLHEGLVMREADTVDKRVRNVTLTPKGRNAVRKILTISA